MDRVRPWHVARCAIRVDGELQSLIVKWQRDGDPDDPGARAAPSQLTTEARTLEFLADVGIDDVPHLVALNAEAQMLIMTEREGLPLDRIIRNDGYNERTKNHLIGFAQALARQHAATVGLSEQFDACLPHLDPVRERRRFLGAGHAPLEAMTTALGGPAMTEAARCEVNEVDRRIDEPGEFLALSNGDAATNNFLVGSSTSIIDFEFAGYRHCLCDLAEFYLPGPGWLTTSDPTTDGVEQAYREALSRAIPSVTDDDRFDADLCSVAFAWARIRLGNLSKIDVRPPGEPSRLQRLITVESAAGLAEARGQFPALAGWHRAVGRWLRQRWPDTDADWTRRGPYQSRT